MDWQLTIIIIANVYLVLAWIWSMVTLSSYIKLGKGFVFVFTPFWLFASKWFKSEGLPYLNRARVHIGIPALAMTTVFVVNMNN